MGAIKDIKEILLKEKEMLHLGKGVSCNLPSSKLKIICTLHSYNTHATNNQMLAGLNLI